MRRLNIGLCKSEDTAYPDFISEYIFDIDSINKESLVDSLDLQASSFVYNLRNNTFGAVIVNIYALNNSEIMLVSILRAIYCTPRFEINIYHYDKDNDTWIYQNFQYVPEINRDTMIAKPHTICDAYY